MRNFPISFSNNPLGIVGILYQLNTGIIISDSMNQSQYRIRAIGVDNKDYSQGHYMMVIGY